MSRVTIIQDIWNNEDDDNLELIEYLEENKSHIFISRRYIIIRS